MSTRSYDASSRRAAADAARTRVLGAARAAFLADGWAGASVPAIAREAGVSTQTVYAAFGSKAGLLKRLVDIDIVGDEEPLAVSERPIVDEVRSARSARRRFELFATFVAGVHDRTAAMSDVCVQAAGSDPELAALVARMEEGRHRGLREYVDLLVETGSLRDGLDPDEATDVVWTLASGANHRALVTVRGWTPEAYAAWLASVLESTVGPSRRSRG